MSNKVEQDLAAFYEEFVEGPGIDKLVGAQERALLQAAQGGTGARIKYAAEDLAQNHGGQVVAGVLATAALANSGPTMAAANAESVGVSGGTAPHAQIARKAPRQTVQDRIVHLRPGQVIYDIAEGVAEHRSVNTMTEVNIIERASDVDSEAEAERLPIGSPVHIPAKDTKAGVMKYVFEPLGGNLTFTAKQNGLTLERLLELNPKYRFDPDFVEAGARLSVGPVEPAAEAPKPHHRHGHHHVAAKPALPVIHPVSKPKIPATKAHRPEHQVLAAPISKPKKPTLAKVAPVAIAQKEPVPNKRRQMEPKHHSVTTSKLGLGFGNALWSDIGQPFSARAAGKAHRTIQVRQLGECASTGHMFGKTTRQVVMNYFMICQGDSVAQAAGVVGNLTQESSLQPEEIQNGGFSKNPADAGSGGYGIAQWTPGSKATNESKKYGIKGPIYTLQTQLTLVSAEMKGQSPTGQRNMAQGLKQVKDPNTAAEKFEQNFEEGPIAAQGGGQLANRQKYAREAAREFNSPALLKGLYAQVQSHRRHEHKGKAHYRPHHKAGNAAIYYAALKYKSVSYSETMIAGHEGVNQWHKHFTKIGPGALLDCSGLVNLAVSDATGGRDQPNENTRTERQDHKRWKQIRYSYASRGDLLQPAIGGHTGNHVEIINYTKGNQIYTFGAHTSHAPQPKQVGPTHYKYNFKDVFLRYVGTKPAPKPPAPRRPAPGKTR